MKPANPAELRELMSKYGQDVAKTARSVVRGLFKRNPEQLRALIRSIRVDITAAGRSADALFLQPALQTRPEVLRSAQDDLLVLARIGPHRAQIIESLVNGWADRHRAEDVLRETLNDADRDLRDSAVSALRALAIRP